METVVKKKRAASTVLTRDAEVEALGYNGGFYYRNALSAGYTHANAIVYAKAQEAARLKREEAQRVHMEEVAKYKDVEPTVEMIKEYFTGSTSNVARPIDGKRCYDYVSFCQCCAAVPGMGSFQEYRNRIHWHYLVGDEKPYKACDSNMEIQIKDGDNTLHIQWKDE